MVFFVASHSFVALTCCQLLCRCQYRTIHGTGRKLCQRESRPDLCHKRNLNTSLLSRFSDLGPLMPHYVLLVNVIASCSAAAQAVSTQRSGGHRLRLLALTAAFSTILVAHIRLELEVAKLISASKRSSGAFLPLIETTMATRSAVVGPLCCCKC